MSVIEDVVKPTDEQRAQFDVLKEASRKAADTITAACPRGYPASASAHLEAMEKRLDAMLGPIKAVGQLSTRFMPPWRTTRDGISIARRVARRHLAMAKVAGNPLSETPTYETICGAARAG